MTTDQRFPTEVRVDLDHRVNFAMQQNDVPVVKAVHIVNQGDAPLRAVRLRIIPEPSFGDPWETRIEVVAAQSTYDLQAVDVPLSPTYLGELTERVRGQLRFQLFQSDDRLCEHLEQVELLARDEWSGLSSLPEILAAFVVPNHPAVEQVLRQAATILGGWTGDPSLSAYQTKDPRRVFLTTAAVYDAIQALELSYVSPPASFEVGGQRIRLPERLLESRMGTCLDLAVFAAACLEQAGLNALVVVVDGHAFTAVWLLDECFGEPAIDDGLRLRKRVDLDEIAVFDPTCVTARPSPRFETAIREAKRYLEDPQRFLCVVDVRRARQGRIRPLPERVERTAAVQPSQGVEEAQGPPSPPDVSGIHVPPVRPPETPEEPRETAASRLVRWRRRLLDLSLRNRLLNFRDTKKTIPLLCPDLAALEDALADAVSFDILSRPGDLSEADPRDAEAHRRRTGEEGVAALLHDQLRSRRLHADLAQEELDRRLLEVYRAARLGLEEGGASALYLAVGFLRWYETAESTQARLAPILLLPLELRRRSVREGFSIRLGDDEPRLNVTLLELLKQDHGITVPGLDPLPVDESGLDVSHILRTVRERVRDIDRWVVVDFARIGLFSFAKFLMWRDLTERAEDLLRNAVVDHLVNRPEEAFDPGGPFPVAERLDDERSPLQTFCPLPADSSQLAAVFAAAEGRSFVLEGPPGTGKSQTITNLIAHCLAEGKTVLFVSEKMAALNVVYDRLRKVGLGRFCLELHSNKAQKRGVLSQLEDALRRFEERAHDEWEREAMHLEKLRAELNAYARALHRRWGTGETAFQATSRLIGLRDVPRVALSWPSPDALDADQLAALRDLVQRLTTAATALGEVRGHAWQGIEHAEWTPGWQARVDDALRGLGEAIDALERGARAVSGRLHVQEGGWSREDLDLLDELAAALLDSPAPPPAILVRPDWEEIQSQIGAWIQNGRQRDALRAEVLARHDERILTLDLDALSRLTATADASWWPKSWWLRRRVRKALQAVSRGRQKPERGELDHLLAQARGLRDAEQALAQAGAAARGLFGRYWNNGEAVWDGLERVRDWARNMRTLALRAARGDLELASALRERWARLASEARDLLPHDATIAREGVTLRSSVERFRAARHAVDELLALDVDRVWGRTQDADVLGIASRRLRVWTEHMNELREWCAWRRARMDAVAANLAPLVLAYEQGEFAARDVPRVFDRSYYQWWHAAVFDADPLLAGFFSPEHERKIERFRAVDDHLLELTRAVVATRLASVVPSVAAGVLPSSELGLLKREIGKKRRHMSVRQLFQTIPNLLPRLKPCLLMSPISVAQYMDAKHPPFDVVVFDEASQIPVWDAVGAIARGKQAVIVGDPKQLPPTSFFMRMEDDDEDVTEAETVEDLESILDDCISARIPWLPLDWHYRSRHESLIAFSNYHYYDNRLLTFPSPQREGMGVSWRHVPDGVYDKGKSRTNRVEAEAVVGEVVRRLTDPEHSGYSIGVVTFSQAQQVLIEDLLEVVRREDVGIDAFFGEEVCEPVFVKNLENVQGDERDVIVFSIGYGPDALGRVSMNFGPMNREGGERRLNVAVTRARREVLVFSTLRAEQIDLARTRARGIRDLKTFLEYAERGPSAIAEATRYDSAADFDSPFEKAVHAALVERGWQVHQQVGCSGYRIDLAILDPAMPGRYLLGIECDGANYHRAKTARDRDKLREGVLRGLGWRLHRVWSTDWWTNPQREIERVVVAIEAAQATRHEARDAPARGQPIPALIARAPASSQPWHLGAPADEVVTAPKLPRYAPLRVGRPLGTPDAFYEPASAAAIRRLVVEVVEHEGPISLELAARRVAAHWGFERVRAKALRHIEALVPKDRVQMQRAETGVFLWHSTQDPGSYDQCRVPGDDPELLRDAEDLPVEEIANGALSLLRQHISVPHRDLVRETSRLFGFQRTGAKVEGRMAAGIDRLVVSGRARINDGNVVLAA